MLFSFATISTAHAQLELYPIQRKNPSSFSKTKTKTKKNEDVARKKSVSLSLPFWDDFSFTPINDTSTAASNEPLTSLWAKGTKVWINDGIGINPPTINVATFDGLDSLGLPYSLEVLANGFRDTLESQPINLAEVVLAERDSVFLSFFYQWQGNGEPPDPTDYMRLEFKNDVGAWETMMTINTKSTFDKTVFYDTIIQVTGDQYFHDAFQFRFKNYGRESGPFDTWNIDYVYLNKGRTISDNSFPDRAAASTISSLFGAFYAMPVKHFFAEKIIDSVKFDIQNLKNNQDYISVSYFAKAHFKNYIDSILTPYSKILVVKDSINILGGLVSAFERTTVTLNPLPDPDDVLQFNPLADSIEIKLEMGAVSGDEIDSLRFDFSPIDFRINDTISTHFFLKDYYAYDDGIAEYSVMLTNSGNKLAYQFTRPASIPDSLAVLNGFEIYFPEFAIVNSPTVDLFVYDDNGGMPGDVLYSIGSYRIQKKGINTFQLVNIGETVVVGPTYYIGWKQPSSGRIAVGLDTSNDTGDKLIVYTSGSWNINTKVKGSLMIRPHFGKAEIVTAVANPEENVQVFPNPSKGEFYVRGKYDRMEIITVTGQPISYTAQQVGSDTRIAIANPNAGLYILKMVKGNVLHTKKIVID